MIKAMTKMADGKGRVTLGSGAANRPVSIQKINEFEYLIKVVRVIPETEAWLYENPAALDAVRTGLQQARTGRVTTGPDLDADKELARQLQG
jgi:hypothetical protein